MGPNLAEGALSLMQDHWKLYSYLHVVAHPGLAMPSSSCVRPEKEPNHPKHVIDPETGESQETMLKGHFNRDGETLEGAQGNKLSQPSEISTVRGSGKPDSPRFQFQSWQSSGMLQWQVKTLRPDMVVTPKGKSMNAHPQLRGVRLYRRGLHEKHAHVLEEHKHSYFE